MFTGYIRWNTSQTKKRGPLRKLHSGTKKFKLHQKLDFLQIIKFFLSYP